MKNLFTFLLFLLIFLVASNRVLAQACTTGCTFTAPSGGTSFDMSGNQLLCITGNVTNIGGNFNGSNNQICLAAGVTWTQNNSKNFGSVSLINVYGNAIHTGSSLGAGTINVYNGATLNLNGGSLNGTTINVNSGGTLIMSNNTTFNSPANTINVNSGATFTTSSTEFNNNLTLNNAGAISFTSTGNINFTGTTSTFNNSAGATVTATATSVFKFGSGITVVNNGTMNFSNLENEEAIKFDNNSTGKITVNRSFYNHGALKNDGLIRTLCASGSGVCEFKVGNKGPGKAYINNACMIVAGDVTFEGPGTLNGTLEILPGYNITINNIVTGSNGYLLVDGGTSTIGAAGQYTGSVSTATSMKFYDVNTGSHDFDAKNNQNNASTYTVLTSAPAASCSATTSTCSVSVAVTNTTCQTATNQYVLTGTVSFSNTGGSTITIQDGTASTTVSTTGTSPQAFTLTGTSLVSNASSHTVTAASSTTACSTTTTATYTSPANCLVIAVSSVTVCGGQTATLTATGCIGSVSWNTGATGTSINIATSSSITSTTVLSYTATCTSGSSTATAVATVTVRPTPPTPTLVVVQTTCIVSTGTITATSAGATSYTLTSGASTSVSATGVFTSLTPGSYTVVAGNGTCSSARSTTTINTAPTTPAAPTLTVVQPTCATSTGSLTAISAGATSYTLTNGGAPVVNGTGIFTSLAPGSYTVIASNGTCNSAGSTVTIVANPGTPVAPALTVLQPTCTTPTGSLTAISVGATSYTLTNGVTPVVNSAGIFTSLAPGSYTVIASNGTCTSTGTPTTIIANPGTPTAPSLVLVQPDCFTPTGTLTATSAGATSFTLTNGVTSIVSPTGVFSDLMPGSYTVIAGNGTCTSAGSPTTIIANPGTPATPVLTVLQPTCATSTGSLTATSAGATSYTLTNGVTLMVNSTGVFTSLAPDSYTVIASNGTCTSGGTLITIIANPGMPGTPALTVTQPDCVIPTGSLTTLSAGANSFTLTNGTTSIANSTGTFTGLAPGSYTVITGNSTCSSSAATATIIANPGTPAAPLLVVVQPTTSTPTGSLTATSAGATSYTLSGPTGGTNTTGIFTGLSQGSYTVTAGNGTCSSPGSTTVINLSSPNVTVVQPDCTTPTGSLTATSAGATSFALSGPVTSINTTGIFAGLTPGSYTVTAGNGISTSLEVLVIINNNPGTPAAPVLSVAQPTCNIATGTITATSAGATSYTLTNGITPIVNATGVFTNLSPGSYTVLAGNGSCSSVGSTTVIVVNPGTPTAPTLSVVQPDCTTPTGSLTATSAGATSYTLTNGITPVVNTTGIFTGVAPDSYTIIASNGTCTSPISIITIIENPGTPAVPVLTVDQPDCATPTGSLTAVSAGATSFTLTGGATPVVNTTGIFSGLAPASYTVTASNSTCRSVASTITVVVNPGTPAAPTLSVVQPDCNIPTGSVTATSSGATSFTLTNGASSVINGTGMFNSLAPGSYTVLAGNSTCISAGTTATIIANPGTPATPTLTVIQPDCTTPTGGLTATSAGATSYTLTNGVTPVVNSTGIFASLAPGSYTVIAGNASCSSVGATMIIIANPGTPTAPVLSVVQPDCTTPTGSLTATSAGANSYTLTDGVTSTVSPTGLFSGLAPSAYTVISGNGTCISAGTPITIIANPGIPATPTLTVVQPTCTTPTGSLTATSAGATSFTLTDGITPVINGTGLFVGLTPGSYTVTAGNGGGCISTIATTTITVAPTAPPMPTAAALCSSTTAATGAISVTSPAMGPGITYSIDGVNYQTSNTFTGLAVGSYTVTVQQNGCTSPPASVSVDVCSPPFPVELIDFSGKWIDGVGNKLNWSTAWERNNDHFEIQRSATAKSFESIGRVVGKGTISTRQLYEYVDAQPVDDISYYRLKQVDADGTTNYSRIIAIDKGESVVTLEVFPNPTSAELSLRVGKGIEEVNVYNNTGHLVLHQVDGKTTLQVSSLSGGVYMVEIKTVTGLILRQRFIKQ